MRNPRLLLVVLTVQFLVSMDVSVVNVALPAIRDGLGFGADAGGLTWVVNAYALTFGGLMMLGGRLGDVAGRRRTLLAGLVLFGAAGLAGGLVTSPGALIAARAVQGAGAAALTPVALALLTTAYPPGPALSRALGLWGAMAAAGGSAGVLLGGVLTDWLNWRAVMLVNVPLVAFALLAAWRLPAGGEQHERPDGTRPRLDLPGAVLVTAGATLLVLGVVRTGTAGWASAATAGTLTAAAVLLTAFVLVERRVPEPLLRPGLLANRAVLGANLFMMLLFSGQFAAFYFTSLYLSGHLGYGPAAAGVAFLPFCLGVAVGSVVATRLVARTGLRALMAAGALVAAAGFAWFGVGFAAGAGVWAAVVGPSLVTSAGIGMCFVPLGTAATAGVGREAAGMASGLVNSSRQIGGSLGLAALETLGARGDGGAALGVAAGLLALAALVALLLVPGRAPRTGGAAAAPAEPPAPRPAVR